MEPHDPLLPVHLASRRRSGAGWLAKLTLCLFAAAVATLTLWTSVRRFAVPVLPAALVAARARAPRRRWPPTGRRSTPRSSAALAAVAAVAALTGPLRRGGLAVLALAVVALPWLSVKYAPVAVVLAGARAVAAAGARAVRARPPGWASAWAGRRAVAFLVVHEALYGGTTPYAAGSYFVDGQLQVIGSHPDYVGRSRRLVGLFVDRDFGIAAWQPAWLALIPALGALAGTPSAGRADAGAAPRRRAGSSRRSSP